MLEFQKRGRRRRVASCGRDDLDVTVCEDSGRQRIRREIGVHTQRQQSIGAEGASAAFG